LSEHFAELKEILKRRLVKLQARNSAQWNSTTFKPRIELQHAQPAFLLVRSNDFPLIWSDGDWSDGETRL
jgi:hypothetical protein